MIVVLFLCLVNSWFVMFSLQLDRNIICSVVILKDQGFKKQLGFVYFYPVVILVLMTSFHRANLQRGSVWVAYFLPVKWLYHLRTA